MRESRAVSFRVRRSGVFVGFVSFFYLVCGFAAVFLSIRSSRSRRRRTTRRTTRTRVRSAVFFAARSSSFWSSSSRSTAFFGGREGERRVVGRFYLSLGRFF